MSDDTDEAAAPATFYQALDEFVLSRLDETTAEWVTALPRVQALDLYERLEGAKLPTLPPLAGSDIAIHPIVRLWDVNLPLLRASVSSAQLALATRDGSVSAFGVTSSGLMNLEDGASATPGVRIRAAVDATGAVRRKLMQVRRLALYADTIRVPVDVLLLPPPSDGSDEIAWAQWDVDVRMKLQTLALLRPLVEAGCVQIGGWNGSPLSQAPRKQEDLRSLQDVPLDPSIRLNVVDSSTNASEFVTSLIRFGLAFDSFAWTYFSGQQVGGTVTFTDDALRRALHAYLSGAVGPHERLVTLGAIVVPDADSLSTRDIIELRSSDSDFAELRSSLTRVAKEVQAFPQERWRENAKDAITQELQPSVASLNKKLRRSRALRKITERAGTKFGIGGLSTIAAASLGSLLNPAAPAVTGVATGLTAATIAALGNEAADLVRDRGEMRTSAAVSRIYTSLLGAAALNFDGGTAPTKSDDEFWRDNDEVESSLRDIGIDLPALRRFVAPDDLPSVVTLLVGNHLVSAGESAHARDLYADLYSDPNTRVAQAAAFGTAYAHLSDGHPVEADAVMRKVLKDRHLEQMWPHAHLALGLAHNEAGRWRKAIPHLRSALESGQPIVQPTAAANLGQIYASRGRAGEALDLYARAAASDQPNPRALAWLNTADLLDDLGREEEAKRAYWQSYVLQVEPWSSQALHDLGALFSKRGKPHIAMRAWRRCAAGPETQWKWRSALAVGHALVNSDSSDDHAEGISLMRDALRHLPEPQRSACALVLAVALAEKGIDRVGMQADPSEIVDLLTIAESAPTRSLRDEAKKARRVVAEVLQAEADLAASKLDLSQG